MFGNYLATALRNLMRNRLHAGVSILCLAIAFLSALLMTQFVRHELSYDRWIPGHEQVYKIISRTEQPGQPPEESDLMPPPLAGDLQLQLSSSTVARLQADYPILRRKSDDEGVVDLSFAWADPKIFTVIPLRPLHGNLKSALAEPNTVVITRRIARKYFGIDNPIGQTFEVQGGPERRLLTVTAVVDDLPSNTTLVPEIFAASHSEGSPLAQFDDAGGAPGALAGPSAFTYVRLAPVDERVFQSALNAAAKPMIDGLAPYGARFAYEGMRIANAHFHPIAVTSLVFKPSGSRTTTLAIGTVAVLIILVAAINFVTLVTARAARRGVEVGVRKASGARRRDLIAQFMGETLLQVTFSMVIALILAAILIHPFSRFLRRDLSLNYLHDPLPLIAALACTLVVGLLAGFYPALVLSSFRPAAVLKGGFVQTAGSALPRQILVVTQFAILLGLMLATSTIYRQTQFALNLGTSGDADRIVSVWTACDGAFPEEVRRLPGVRAAACSSLSALNVPTARSMSVVSLPDGRRPSFGVGPVDFGYFELLGVNPLGGRLFSRTYPRDAVAAQSAEASPPVIVNETAARALGFSDPAHAVGSELRWLGSTGFAQPPTPRQSEIVGVVPDIPANIRVAAEPAFYYYSPSQFGMLVIKLSGADMPGTVRSVERLWKETGHIIPIQISFRSQHRRDLYEDMLILGAVMSICAGLSVLIGCLGLFALAAYTTERRTKEIGIRKAMGASTRDVVLLLVWQFTIPVLWAIAIASPAAYFVLENWLHGFSYRVEQSPWTFVLGAVLVVTVAWLTVAGQSYLVARAKPAGALRYE